MTLDEAVAVIDNPESEDRTVARTLHWLASVEREDLEASMVRQASDYAYFGALYEAARALVSARKMDLDATESVTFAQLHNQEGKSAAASNALLPSQPEVIEAKENYTTATLIAGRYDRLLRALAERKDMLVMLVKRQHVEMEHYGS